MGKTWRKSMYTSYNIQDLIKNRDFGSIANRPTHLCTYPIALKTHADANHGIIVETFKEEMSSNL